MLTAAAVQAYLDSLAKPRGSLGRLEDLAIRLAVIQNTLRPTTRPRRLVVFAADHGVVASGVSAWPSSVTGLMVETILAGRAASSALAAAQSCDLRLVDVGIAAPPRLNPAALYEDARIAPGTKDLAHEAALSEQEFEMAWQVGVREAERAVREGFSVLIAGEMGIGNTTPAACLTMLLTGAALDIAVGRGAGADDATLARKRTVVAKAVESAASLLASEPRRALAAVAGFEIVAMAGFLAAGSSLGATLLLDGYVATSAALLASRFKPRVTGSLIASHVSSEFGHGHALAHLGLPPLLDWNMRLGEGTGALVALPLLDSAAALLTDVAALSALGVTRED